jgi:hypothetical protein
MFVVCEIRCRWVAIVGTYKKLSDVESAGLCQRAERCTLDSGRAKRWDRRSDCARGGCDDILKVLCSTMSTWIRMGRDAGGRCVEAPGCNDRGLYTEQGEARRSVRRSYGGSLFVGFENDKMWGTGRTM